MSKKQISLDQYDMQKSWEPTAPLFEDLPDCHCSEKEATLDKVFQELLKAYEDGTGSYDIIRQNVCNCITILTEVGG